jgi:iron complex transport system ATP-binding protein
MKAIDVVVETPQGRRILGPVSIDIAPGEWVTILGRNGAGKTTLCNAVAGAIQPTSGTIERHERIGLLSQSPTRPYGLTTLEYTLLGCSASWRGENATEVNRARRSIEACALDPDQDVGTLSGGEFRKAGIARLLTLDPGVFILDEPGAGLDPQARIETLNLLDSLRGDRAVITVMHDLMTAAQFGHRFLIMDQGRIVAQGTRDEVMTSEILQRAYGESMTVVDVDGAPVPIARR